MVVQSDVYDAIHIHAKFDEKAVQDYKHNYCLYFVWFFHPECILFTSLIVSMGDA